MKRAIVINDSEVLFKLMGAIGCRGECIPSGAELEIMGDNVKVSIYHKDSNNNTARYYFEVINRKRDLPLQADRMLRDFLNNEQSTLVLHYI